jgi:hypothetical protein
MIRAGIPLKENIGATDVRGKRPGDQDREDKPNNVNRLHLG